MEKLDITTQIQTHVLSHLINDEEYLRRVIPYLKPDYFEQPHRGVFDLVVDFVNKHNKMPTGKVLELELKKVQLPDDVRINATECISECKSKSDLEHDYLVSETFYVCYLESFY